MKVAKFSMDYICLGEREKLVPLFQVRAENLSPSSLPVTKTHWKSCNSWYETYLVRVLLCEF